MKSTNNPIYYYNCANCGRLKDDEVQIKGDVFDNSYCKKCNIKVQLIKTSSTKTKNK